MNDVICVFIDHHDVYIFYAMDSQYKNNNLIFTITEQYKKYLHRTQV